MNKELFTCNWCNKEYWEEKLCPPCRKQRKQPNEVHHGAKAPDGKCQQCLEVLPLKRAWNDKYYCKDCRKWNDEGAKQGIGTFNPRFLKTWCGRIKDKGCGKESCQSCSIRKKLDGISTRDLMIEVMTREDFEALLTWEDDGWKLRYGEIMWELTQIKGLSPNEIEKKVDDDVFKKKFSQRKFSRGT